MRKISALLIAFILLLQICVIPTSAAESSTIILSGTDCYANTAVEKSEAQGIRISTNQYGAYKVNFENPTSVLKINYTTGYEHCHVVEVRLGSQSGKLLGSFDSRVEASSSTWAEYQHIFSFDEPLIGEQSIFVIGRGGNHWIKQLTFVSSGSGTFASFAENDNFEDIKDDKNRNQINLLSDLGMIPKADKNFMPDLPMTRLEFVSMLGRLINAASYAKEVSPFKDIETSDEHSSILSGLYQMGIIKGDTDGKFWPYRYITIAEVATVCVNALGYKPFAKNMINAVEIANSNDIFDGINMGNKTITNSDAARIIYNLLLCDYLKVSEYADEAVFYEPTKNFLEKNSEYKYGKGVLTSNAITGLYEAKKSKGITIDGEYFEEGKVNCDYLGVLCEYFYVEDGGLKTLKAIRPAEKAEVTVVRSGTDIKFEKINEREIFYTTISDDEEYEFELAAQTSIIYNGTALNGSLRSLINPTNFMGTLTIIDNDGDGTLECVWIDHVSSVVKTSGISGNKIKDKISGQILDLSDDSTALFINGQGGFADQLKIDDVLYVYQSSTTGKNNLTRVVLAGTKVSGIITEKTNDGKVKIDDVTYKISSACEESIYVGLSGAFYIDDFSNIVRYEAETIASKVGAFLGINLKNSLDFDMEVKLLTEDGVEVFEVAKNIKADGVIVKKEEDFYNGTGVFDGIKNIALKTPIVYSLNNDNELKLIDTVNIGTNGDDDNIAKLGEEAPFRYLGGVLVNTSTWKYLYPAHNDTAVIKMTSDNDENFFSITKGFTDRDGSGIPVTPYTINKDSMVADILISVDWPTDVNYVSAPFVFDDIKVKVNSDGDAARYICGEAATGEVSFEIDENSYASNAAFRTLLDSAKKGDLLLPYLTREKLISLDLLYLPGALTTNAAGVAAKIYDGVATTNGSMKHGTVEKIENGFAKIVLDGETDFQVYACSSAKVLVCEKEAGGNYKITSELSSNAMFEGEKVMIRTSTYSVVTAVYIYRGDRS